MEQVEKNKEQIELILKGVRELEDSKKKLKFGFWVVFIMCCMSIGMVISLAACKKVKDKSSYNSRNDTNKNSDKDLFQSFHSLKQITIK